MSPTFVHCSDLHLGRERMGGKLPESDLEEAFCYIIRTTLEMGADGLLIAGDLFDSPHIQPRHLQAAIRCFLPLKEKGIPVFAIEGNHDRPSLSAETATWVRYLNDEGYLHLLTIPFTPAGPEVTPWDPVSRRGSYLDYQGVRIVGAGYLGAGTVRRMRAIAASLAGIQEREGPKPTILLLHAGPDYLVHEGGGFDRESLGFLREHVGYLALGHIHKPLCYQDWAVNPGTAENIRLEEAEYGYKEGRELPRGLAVVRVDPGQETPEFRVELRPTPRRPVREITLDCSPFTGKNAGAKIGQALLRQAAQMQMAPVTVLRVCLEGELNLERAGLDLKELAAMLEQKIPVAVVECILGGMNHLVSQTEDVDAAENRLARETLEQNAVYQILRETPPEGVAEEELLELAELFLAFKEDLRQEARPEEILERLAGHRVVQNLAERLTQERLQSMESENQVAAGEEGTHK